jgi:hypothetical protein
MEIARFDPAGGPILVELSCTPRRDGSYSLTLWDADENRRVKRWSGNFINPSDDRYELPPPASDHDRRILESIVVVAVPPGVGPATVSMTVSQDGRELAMAPQDIPPNSAGGVADLFVKLEAR